jgi:integrase
MRGQPGDAMSIYKREGTENYFYSISVKGKRIRGSTGLADRKEAQRYHDELKASLWNEVVNGYSWDDACIAWLTHEERSESDRYTIRKLAMPNKALTEYTATDFTERFPSTPGTFNRYAALVAAILNMAVSQGKVGAVPKIPRKTVKETRIRWLTKEEWDALYKELPAHLKPLAAFSIHTGLRQSNVTRLTWREVDIKRRVMWVFGDSMKAGKAIGIPLSDEAVTILKSQQGKDDVLVFPYRRHYKDESRERNAPIGKIKGAWMKALKRAGLGTTIKVGDKEIFKTEFTWHGLRHTWATWHVMSGTPLPVLMKLGGWSSMAMLTKHYAHFAPDYIAGYANNAKPYTVTETVTVAA